MAKQQCKARNRTGQRCNGNAGADGYCFTHSPNKAAERSAARKLGGYHRNMAAARVSGDTPIVIASMADVLALINATIADTWQQDNGAARSRALLACADIAIKALTVGEFEARLAALERGQGDRGNAHQTLA